VEFRTLTKYKQQETFHYILDKLGMAYMKNQPVNIIKITLNILPILIF